MLLKTRLPINQLLLVAVNVPLGLTLAILLTLDYRREMQNSTVERQGWLNEEAATIYRGLYFLGKRSSHSQIQRFINSASARLPGSEPPLHHVAVRWNGGLIQSQTDRGTSQQQLRAVIERVDESADRLTSMEKQLLVLGRFSDGDVTVYVAELATSIQATARRHILLHLLSLLLLASMAAAIVNIVLWRVVGRPIKRLATSVKAITAGGRALPYEPFQSRELDDLSAVIHTMSETLAANDEGRRAQMARARLIQQNLLPKQFEVPGLRLAHLFQPAEDVAGDYYDIVPLNDEGWLICVADVTGHGIPAAIGAAILKAVLLDAASRNITPGEVLNRVNERLMALLPDLFVSMLAVRWKPAIAEVCYASAGHEPALHLREDKSVEMLQATGPLLGVCKNGEWETHSIDVAKGDRMLLSTDGITEADSPRGELLGRDALAATFKNCAALSCPETITAIVQAVKDHQKEAPAKDDLTAVVLEIADK